MLRKVLIVDDNDINRQMLHNALNKEYDIIEAGDGKEALELMHRNCNILSAVLLDIIMPEMDGYDVLRAMRDNAMLAQIPVIMVTGSENEEARTKALSLGANDFILKPFNPEIIKHCLRNNILMRENASILNAIQKDKLTGLYNREAFFEKAGAMIKDREPGYYILSCFDVDNFKLINDQYGAAEGDNILKEIGHAIKGSMDNIGGLAGRISADNFTALLPVSAKDQNILQEIQNRMPVLLEQRYIAFSIGRYLITETSLAVSAIYDRAYLAKQSVKGRFDKHMAYFDEAMLQDLIRNQQIVSDMEKALVEGQFEVWYQPQYNHVSGAITGAEALVRWNHPQKGLISPGDFIPLFEQNGFVYEMDKYVWREACRCIRRWIDKGLSPVPISVNVSRYDIFRTDLIDTIMGMIKEYNIPIELLRLEITESAFAKTTDIIVEIVKKLINIGFTVEIDDFGSGYSSLNTLKSVPAHVLKLDMRFLEDGDDEQRGGNILESIVRMSKWLGMSVIAEGVETKEQGDFLKSIGCNQIQGYLYAKAMPADEYESHFTNAVKSGTLNSLETIERYDNSMFWNPKSMESLIFNSYVGTASIYEYCNGKFELIRATDKYAHMLGGEDMTVEKLMKLDLAKYLDKDVAKEIFAKVEAFADTKEEITGEFLFVGIPGCPEKVYTRSNMRVIASASNRHLIYCISENITAQRVSERKERNVAKQLQVIMSNISCGITAVTVNGESVEYVLANDQFYEILGYTRDEFREKVGSRLLGVVYSEDRVRVRDVVNKIKMSKISESMEYRAVRRDGKIIWLRSFLSMTNFEDVDGDVQLCTYVDISKDRETEYKQEFLINNIPGGIAIYEGQWSTLESIKLTYFSDGFSQLFGYSREEYEKLGKDNPTGLVAKEYLPGFVKQIENLVKNNVPLDYIYRAICKGENYRWIHVKALQGEKHGDNMTVNAMFFDVTSHQDALESLRVSEEENRLAIRHSENVVCRYNVASKTLNVSSSASSKFELDTVLEDVPYGPVNSGRISKETANAYINFYEAIDNGERRGSVVFQRNSKIGWRWIRARFSTIYSSDNKPVSAVISFLDVTESFEKDAAYKKWMQSLHNSEPESYSLFRCNVTRRTVFDTVEGSLLSVVFKSEPATIEEHTEQYVNQYVLEEDKERFRNFMDIGSLLEKYYGGDRIITVDFREKLENEGYRWLRLTVDLVEYPHSNDVEAYLLFEDIDKIKRAELLTIARAETDPLTGALNRMAFAQKVNQRIQTSAADAKHALIMMDIDGFKLVNDTFGHNAGDQILVELAGELKSVLRREDVVGRLGGDEFFVFMNNIPDEKIAATKAKQICGISRKSISAEVQISGSVGVAVYPYDGADFETLYKKADEALYYVKGSGRNNFAFYHDDMKDEHLKIEPDVLPKSSTGINEKKRRMLIVDDNIIDNKLLENMFKDDFMIEKAKDGKTALIRLRHYGSAVSIVLLDLMMPGIDGFAVLEQMQKTPELQAIPVVVVSGAEDHQISLRAIRGGASDFVTKPVDADVLRIRVQSAISKADNERLRVKNSFLELQNAETVRYKMVLEKLGLAVVEMNWGKGTFTYGHTITRYLSGNYDGRALWHILLSDLVASAGDVKELQQMVHNLADDRKKLEDSINVKLKVPTGGRHEFCVQVYKIANEYGLTDKLLITFKDLDVDKTRNN